MKTRRLELSVFDFTDPYQYLQQAFAALRVSHPKLSFQKLQDELELTSKSQVHRLLHGTRHQIQRPLMVKLNRFFGHSARESEYFQTLLAYAEASTTEDRIFFLEALQRIVRPVAKYRMREQEFRYFNDWYIPIVRELVTMKHWDGDFTKLAEQIHPNITPTQAKRAFELLVELQMIKQNGSQWVQTQQALVPDPEIRKLAVKSFQLQHLRNAEKAMAESDPSKHHLGALTIGTSEEGRIAIQKRISEFISEIVDIAGKYDHDMNQVCQLNLQFYPVGSNLRA